MNGFDHSKDRPILSSVNIRFVHAPFDPDYRKTPVPRMLWVELTSKCPFDCVFCTRRSRFGAGQHLDFAIFERTIAELDRPDYICLNYSGESIYYPCIIDAIRLAKTTTAMTQLVTTFSTVTEPILRGIVEAGLDSLSISVHAMDPDQYRQIYKYGSVEGLRERIAELNEAKRELGYLTPRLDICFVAMEQNLDQLLPVARFALESGAPGVLVHPLLSRHPLPQDFSAELDPNRLLREQFKIRLRAAIDNVHRELPAARVDILNPDVEPHQALSHAPVNYPARLPAGARIHNCEQSPFDSVHILSTGHVVVCEVLDEISMGDLTHQTLNEVWNGVPYRAFRERYVNGTVPQCQTCVWKTAYLPGKPQSAIVPSEAMSAQLLRGWHAYEGNGVVWGKTEAVLVLDNSARCKNVHLQGVLPSQGLTIDCNGASIGKVSNATTQPMQFDTVLPIPDSPEAYITMTVDRTYRPALKTESTDGRDLGVGLYRAEVVD